MKWGGIDKNGKPWYQLRLEEAADWSEAREELKRIRNYGDEPNSEPDMWFDGFSREVERTLNGSYKS